MLRTINRVSYSAFNNIEPINQLNTFGWSEFGNQANDIRNNKNRDWFTGNTDVHNYSSSSTFEIVGWKKAKGNSIPNNININLDQHIFISVDNRRQGRILALLYQIIS